MLSLRPPPSSQLFCPEPEPELQAAPEPEPELQAPQPELVGVL